VKEKREERREKREEIKKRAGNALAGWIGNIWRQ
jgi:hypothetical protein